MPTWRGDTCNSTVTAFDCNWSRLMLLLLRLISSVVVTVVYAELRVIVSQGDCFCCSDYDVAVINVVADVTTSLPPIVLLIIPPKPNRLLPYEVWHRHDSWTSGSYLRVLDRRVDDGAYLLMFDTATTVELLIHHWGFWTDGRMMGRRLHRFAGIPSLGEESRVYV